MYRIYISTFGNPTIHIKGGIPIEVGAAVRKEFIYKLYDDTGENISNENAYYGELTGLYWIWKNIEIHDDDVIGFCHYNKAFKISQKQVCMYLKNNLNAIITISPVKIRDHPILEEVEAITSLLKEYWPAYYEVWNRQYDETAAGRYAVCRGGNMFITTGRIFHEYCTWVFDVLKMMRACIGGKNGNDANMHRYCAFMGERLLSVYIEVNQLSVMGVKIRYKKWWLPYARTIVRSLNINKKNRIYILLRKYLGYTSQYQIKK